MNVDQIFFCSSELEGLEASSWSLFSGSQFIVVDTGFDGSAKLPESLSLFQFRNFCFRRTACKTYSNQPILSLTESTWLNMNLVCEWSPGYKRFCNVDLRAKSLHWISVHTGKYFPQNNVYFSNCFAARNASFRSFIRHVGHMRIFNQKPYFSDSETKHLLIWKIKKN